MTAGCFSAPLANYRYLSVAGNNVRSEREPVTGEACESPRVSSFPEIYNRAYEDAIQKAGSANALKDAEIWESRNFANPYFICVRVKGKPVTVDFKDARSNTEAAK